MTQRLCDRLALVTGGTSGIGRATVARFVAEGARVVFCGTNEEAGARVEREHGGRATFKQCDVGIEHEVEALVAFAIAQMGSVNLLVNNVGMMAAGLVTTMATERWHRIAAVTLDSVFFTSRLLVAHMEENGGGVVVNVASVSALAGEGALPAYSAQKAAVVNLTRAMAVYHARNNVRINAVCPGLTDTAAAAALKANSEEWRRWVTNIPMQRAGTADEIAAIITFLASNDASYMAGAILVADGGLSAATGQPTQVPG